MATILLTSPSPGESPVLSKAIHKPAESKAQMGESIEPRILPPWAYSPHSAWGFLRLTSVGLFVYGEHLSLLPLSESSNYHTNLPMGTVIRNSIKWSICSLWIVSPTNAFLPRLRVLLFWEYKSHCTHSVWKADMLSSRHSPRKSSHPLLRDWKGFSCTHHNYCLCKQFRTLQAITLGGNPHSCELCFGSDPSQDLRSNVNHPVLFQAPGKN